MSDQSDVPANEPVEVAQDATVQDAAIEHPWGDDFDPERAWKTIQNLRQFEKTAKEFERIQSDETARTEWLRGQGYEVETADADDSEEELFEEDDPVAPVRKDLDELKTWQREREQERINGLIKADLDSYNEDSGWDLDDDDRADIVARATRLNPKGFGPDDLKKAHEAFIARLNRAGENGVEKAKKPKPSPSHVPSGGKAATGTKNVAEMNTREREAWMVQRAQEMNAGS